MWRSHGPIVDGAHTRRFTKRPKTRVPTHGFRGKTRTPNHNFQDDTTTRDEEIYVKALGDIPHQYTKGSALILEGLTGNQYDKYVRPKALLEVGTHSAVVLRDFLDANQRYYLEKLLEKENWYEVKTSNNKTRQDMMASFFAKHDGSEYSWGKNKYLAVNNYKIGILAARLSRVCDIHFNVSSAIKYLCSGTRLPKHRDNERYHSTTLIASISVGPDTDFEICPHNKRPTSLKIRSGDLVLFDGNDLHSARTGQMKGRIRYNLTFRMFITPSEEGRIQQSWDFQCDCRETTDKERKRPRAARMQLACRIHNESIFSRKNTTRLS